jgi:WD40 repeat protein
MREVAIGDLVVEVLHNRGDDEAPDWTVGSGFLIGRGLVLTASHNIGPGELLVRVHGSEECVASVSKRGDGDLDLAVVEIVDSRLEAPPRRYGAVDRDSAAVVGRCWAVGFPRFKERPGKAKPMRLTAQVNGEIPTAENLGHQLLTLRVTGAPRALPNGGLPESEWSGMSGAVVFADDVIVGVITEHHRPEGESSLTVVPLTAIDQLEDHEAAAWWELLGVDRAQLVRLPVDGHRRRPAYWATVMEMAPTTLVGRETELAELAAFATGQDGYRWHVGGPWTGKTALAAHFVRICPPEVDVVAYFLVRRRSDADSGRFLQAVNDQLARLLGEEPERHDDPDTFKDLWSRAAERALAADRHLLLVVDGLDEDMGPSQSRPSVAQQLPRLAGGHAHVLVSSRRYPRLPDDVDADHPLREALAVELAPSPMAAELERRARQDLGQLLFRKDADWLVGDLLGLLAAAQGPLGLDDLTALTKLAEPTVRRRAVAWTVGEEIARVLEPTADDRFVFGHDTLREQAEAAFDPSELDGYRQRIHAWAEGVHRQRWLAEPPPPRYLLDTYPALLLRTAPERLEALYQDLSYVEAALPALGVDRVAADLHAVSSARRDDGALGLLAMLVDRGGHHLRPPYPLLEPGFVTRQLCLQALSSGLDHMAERARQQLARLDGSQLLPRWTSRRTADELARTLEGHTGDVSAVDISAAGVLAMSAGDDATVRLWDLATGEVVRRLEGHTRPVLAVAMSTDANRAISGDAAGTVAVWELATGALLHTLVDPGNKMVRALAISADGTRVVSGTDDTVRVWDLTTGRLTHWREEGALAVAISADGARVASGGWRGEMWLWDLHTGELLRGLEYGPDAERPRPPDAWEELHEALDRRVMAVTITVDGSKVLDGDGRGKIRVWDAASGDLVRKMQRHPGPLGTIAVNMDGTRAVSGRYDGLVRVWDLNADGPVRTLEGHIGRVLAVAVTADGQRVVSGGSDETVRVWDLGAQGRGRSVGGHNAAVGAIATSADGTRAMSGDYDGTLLVWDLLARERLHTLRQGDGSVRAIAMSADGGWAVSAGDVEDEPVKLWDLGTGEVVRTLTGQLSAAMSADGTRAITGDTKGTVRVWDLGTGELVHTLQGHVGYIWAVAMSADSDRAVSGDGNRTLAVWDLTAGTLLERQTGWVGPLAMNADGSRVLSGSEDGRLAVWDVATGGRLRTLEGHTGQVQAVLLTPDGTRAVTSADDMTLRVWDLTTSRCLGVFSCASRVFAIARAETSGSTIELVTGDESAAITLYDLLE